MVLFELDGAAAAMKVEVQIEAASKCKVVAALLLVVNVC
jgi:hypothetical protein